MGLLQRFDWLNRMAGQELFPVIFYSS
jgi:hypothetical protein